MGKWRRRRRRPREKLENCCAAGAAPGKNWGIAAPQAPPKGKIEQIAAPQALTFNWSGGGVSPHTGCFFYPREGGPAGPVCPLSVSLSQDPQNPPKIHREVCGFGGSRRSFWSLGGRSVSASWRTRFPLRNGVSEFSELSGQISQELDWGGRPWPGAGALARGLLVPGRGPGVSRGPRQSQGSARAEAAQSVGQSHCRAWQQLAAARGHHGGCIPG
eukprot:gene4304-biopygen11447